MLAHSADRSGAGQPKRLVGTVILLALLCCLSAATSRGEAASEADTMTLSDAKRVGAGKKVPISSVNQMKQLITACARVEGLCKRRFMASLNELDGILRLPRESLCDEKSLEMIKQFHFRFISPMRPLNKRLTQFEPDPKEVVRAQLHPEPRKFSLEFDDYNQLLAMPISVRHFWLSFALQLSAQCKRNLLDNLKTDAEKYLGASKELLVDMFNNENPIGQILIDGMTLINFDNVLYMPELEGEIKGASKPNDRQVFVKTEASGSSSLFTLVKACQSHFKPIYDKLLIPVIKLGKLGYDYQGDKLTSDEKRQLLGPEVKTWLGLVKICEMFDKVIVLQRGTGDAKQGEPSVAGDGLAEPEVAGGEEIGQEGDGGANQFVTITREEAEALERQSEAIEQQQQQQDNDGRSPISADRIEADNVIEYKPAKFNIMDDELWVVSERQLDLELSKKAGNTNPFGFKGFLRRAGAKIRSVVAQMDPDKFAKYRRNSLWWSGVLNLISGVTNFASTCTTATYVILAIV